MVQCGSQHQQGPHDTGARDLLGLVCGLGASSEPGAGQLHPQVPLRLTLESRVVPGCWRELPLGEGLPGPAPWGLQSLPSPHSFPVNQQCWPVLDLLEDDGAGVERPCALHALLLVSLECGTRVTAEVLTTPPIPRRLLCGEHMAPVCHPPVLELCAGISRMRVGPVCFSLWSCLTCCQCGPIPWGLQGLAPTGSSVAAPALHSGHVAEFLGYRCAHGVTRRVWTRCISGELGVAWACMSPWSEFTHCHAPVGPKATCVGALGAGGLTEARCWQSQQSDLTGS